MINVRLKPEVVTGEPLLAKINIAWPGSEPETVTLDLTVFNDEWTESAQGLVLVVLMLLLLNEL